MNQLALFRIQSARERHRLTQEERSRRIAEAHKKQKEESLDERAERIWREKHSAEEAAYYSATGRIWNQSRYCGTTTTVMGGNRGRG